MTPEFAELFKNEITSVYGKYAADSGILAERFFRYYEDLTETNGKFNLTAVTELHEVMKKHFADSLLPLEAGVIGRGAVCSDVGTGAGFPGMPLAVFRPDISMTLIDSLQKRLGFLDRVIAETDTVNASTLHIRAEDYAKGDGREKYDIVFSRAVARLVSLAEICLPLVKVGGIMIAFKSQSAEDELKEAEKAIKLLGGKLRTVYGTPERNLIIIDKTSPTPLIYPRKAGTPEKFPLI